jgi:hypothetical protein
MVKEEVMITTFHGINKRKKYSTISVANRKGKKVDSKRCADLKKSILRILVVRMH